MFCVFRLGCFGFKLVLKNFVVICVTILLIALLPCLLVFCWVCYLFAFRMLGGLRWAYSFIRFILSKSVSVDIICFVFRFLWLQCETQL